MLSLCWLASCLLIVLQRTACRDTEVSCVFMKRCILPCSFQTGTDSIIHWIQVTAEEARVHSFYHNQDQLGHQYQRFTNRTLLFKDQISSGNASLQLTGVNVRDEGRYKCHTSTIGGNKDSFVNLKVDAPVNEVKIDYVKNRITCSSEGIYPEPKLTWSISPPSNIISNKTTVQQDEQLLYTISSSLILSSSIYDLIFSCIVSTHRNRRKATFRQLSDVSGPSTGITIRCTTSHASVTNFSLIWRFNNSQTIVTQTGTNITYSDQWRQQVKNVSEWGSLTLQGLSSKQEGIYTCKLSSAEETHITNIFLRINKGGGTNTAAIATAAVFIILLIILLILAQHYYRCLKLDCTS